MHAMIVALFVGVRFVLDYKFTMNFVLVV